MQKVFFVGVGGFIGASLRYLVSLASVKLFGTQLPYGTLIVNALGGLLIGFIMELSLVSGMMSPTMKLFLTTGILGGLTTFSAFSYETANLLEDGSYLFAVLNIGLNIILSIGGAVLGKLAAQML